MWRVRGLITVVALGSLVVGCGGDESRPAGSKDQPASPTASPPERSESGPLLATLLDQSQVLTSGVLGGQFSLEDVEYTSPTDAGASFWDCRKHLTDTCTSAIVTTADNWAHAAAIAIPEAVADLVDFEPVGGGSVAIKAENQFTGSSYPPFILRPDGSTARLRVTKEARDLDVDDVALVGTIGDSEWDPGSGRGFWAVDVATAEAFPVRLAPPDCCTGWEEVAARPGVTLTWGSYKRKVGDGVWRFAQSDDGARTWRTTDVRLPLGDTWIYRYTDDYMTAVGPGRMHAIAMTKEEQDGPRYLWELWITEDEQAFHRVALSRTPKDLGGIAFAADGTLLLGEATGDRIWRLPRGGSAIEPVPDAPRLSEPSHWWTLFSSGGVIVARTGERALAVSTDGSTWARVTPGG